MYAVSGESLEVARERECDKESSQRLAVCLAGLWLHIPNEAATIRTVFM